MLRFPCPHCDTVLKTATSMAGEVVSCGHCHHRLRVPLAPPKRSSFSLRDIGFLLLAIIATGVVTVVTWSYWKSSRSPIVAKTDHNGREEPSKTIQPVAVSLEPRNNVEVPPTPPPATDIDRALDRLNQARLAANLAEVRLDAEASRRAAELAKTLLNRGQSFSFAVEHPTAAIAWKESGSAIANWLDGPLHRDLLLARGREFVGIGTARDAKGRVVTVLDGLFASQLAVGSDPAVLYPVPAQTRVPLSFPGNEVPDPLPDVKDKLAGYPITVQFQRRARVTAVEALLEDVEGKTVSAHISTPENPANKEFAANQQNTVCLFAKKPLVPGTRYLVRVRARVDGREWSRLWAFATQPETDGIPRMKEAALRQLNAYRKEAGLVSVSEDDAMSFACQAHASYLAQHLDRVPGLSLYEEKESLDGYTKEGAAIGAKCTIRLGGGSGPADAVDWLMTSVLNRNLVLNPTVQRIGLGTAIHAPRGWIWVLHLPGLRKRGDGPPVVYPGPGQKNVPLFFARDIRELVPDAPRDGRAGFPISVNFFPLAKVTDVQAKLFHSDGNEVPIWVSTPQKRLPGTGNYSQIVLIPKNVLAPASEYRAVVEAQVDGISLSREWIFFTQNPKADELRVGDTLLTQLNAHRRRSGLEPVERDESLSSACRFHVEYIVRNIDNPKTQGLNIHDEDNSLPGYTEAGKQAGKASVIAVISDPIDSIDMWMGTLYHRLPLLDPSLKRIGYAQKQHPIRGWITVLDCNSGR